MPFYLFWLGDSVPIRKWTTEKVGTFILTSLLENLEKAHFFVGPIPQANGSSRG